MSINSLLDIAFANFLDSRLNSGTIVITPLLSTFPKNALWAVQCSKKGTQLIIFYGMHLTPSGRRQLCNKDLEFLPKIYIRNSVKGI